MGRIPPRQVAGLDLIDKLFFNQTLVLCLFTEELGWLHNLNVEIDGKLTGKGLVGLQRQIVKHSVYCMMEAELSESLLLLNEVYPGQFPELPKNISKEQYENLSRFNIEDFQAMVLALTRLAHESSMQAIVEISNELLAKYKKAPATVRYRLTERMFAFEFIFAPIDCFTWLAKMGVLDSDKHPSVALEARYTPDFLQRLTLLCELDTLRDFTSRARAPEGYRGRSLLGVLKGLSEETIKLILAQEFKTLETHSLPQLKHSVPTALLTELEDPKRVQAFFSSLNKYAIRFRLFRGPLSSWIGMLCGGFVEVLLQVQDQRKSVYSAEFNDGSLTNDISEGMSRRGFEITARTIYERHRDFKESILEIVNAYYKLMILENIAFPPDMIDLTYTRLAPYVDQFKPKARRPARLPT